MISGNTFSRRTYNKSFFLKILRFSELHIFLSSLFHSIYTEEKKEFWKKLCFTVSCGILLAFLVLCILTEVGIISDRYFGDWFLNILKKRHSLLYHLLFSRVSKPIIARKKTNETLYSFFVSTLPPPNNVGVDA